jgi:hypothetical protein
MVTAKEAVVTPGLKRDICRSNHSEGVEMLCEMDEGMKPISSGT